MTTYLGGVQEKLRKAELAEAEAKAKAAEEAKRRRLTLALAATVLLALTLGGGGWLWVKAEREAQQSRVNSETNDALSQAALLREKAKTATTGTAALFAQAREQVQRALALVENGPADDTLKAQVQRLKAELDEEEKDRVLITALDEARLAQAVTQSMNRFAPERAVPKFREAFAAYGLPAGQGEPSAAGERFRQRPPAVREAIVAALDEWDDLAGNLEYGITEPHREWLQAVLAAAEPDDALGRQVRAARAEKDLAKRRVALEKLAASVDVTKVPAHGLTRLAQRLAPASRVALLRRAQAQYPADFWINEDLGRALYSTWPPELVEAVRFLTGAVAVLPDSPGANLNLGSALFDKGQVDEAIACYQRAIALDPKNAGAHNGLGIALNAKGQVDEAIACSRKAIALDPKLAGAYSNMGLTLLEKGQVDEAIANCRKAVAVDPKCVEAHHNLGKALYHKGQLDEAIASFRTAIALDPKAFRAHSGLGAVLREKGQLEEAIASCRTAIELDPNFGSAHMHLGNALRDKGQLDEAIASCKKAIQLDPKDAMAHNNLGIALQYKGQLDEAIASHRKAVELDPKLALAHLNLGGALYGKGLVDEAIASYKKALALDPKLAAVHNNLGAALSDKGQLDDAIACYQKALALDPNYASAHSNLGIALQARGQLDEAIACYQKAITLDPKHANAHNNLGSALKAKGQLDEAIACYKQALNLDPKQVEARQGLARAERLAAARDKLAAYLNGSYTPASSAECLDLAEWCEIKKLHHTASRLYADAFAADAQLADDLEAQHRYNAACCAALAAAGQGEDATKLGDQGRARLRKQGLSWLRADLVAYAKLIASGPPAARNLVLTRLQHWQQDSDLPGLRDQDALVKLPAEERAACERLWADVAALLKKAATPAKKDTKP
jgi:superkiller protein 3